MNNKENNSSKIACFAAILGFFGVATGAFGAHALKTRLHDAGMTEVWATAVQYQLVHAIALLTLAAWIEAGAAKGNRGATVAVRAGYCWAAGVVLFSGSLYALALGGPRWLGPVTPLGGLFLLAGWALLGFAAWRGRIQ